MKSVKVAYVFLFILLGILGYFTYLKFSYVEEKKEVNTVQVNSVPLSTIANNYNNVVYDDGTVTSAKINGNNLSVTYDNKEYAFSFVNGILKLNMVVNDNVDVNSLNKMFIDLVDAVSVSMGNAEKESYVTTNLIINNIYVNETVKVIKTNTDITYVIDTTKNMVLYKASNVYHDTSIVNINDKNFDVEINNIKLISPTIKFDNEKNVYNVIFYVINSENKNANITVTLYDKEKKELAKQEVSASDIDNIINIDFELNNFTEEDVIYYSLQIS